MLALKQPYVEQPLSYPLAEVLPTRLEPTDYQIFSDALDNHALMLLHKSHHMAVL